MQVKCALCEQTKTLEDYSFEQKKYKNHPLRIYMCEECHRRIASVSIQRLEDRKNKQTKNEEPMSQTH